MNKHTVLDNKQVAGLRHLTDAELDDVSGKADAIQSDSLRYMGLIQERQGQEIPIDPDEISEAWEIVEWVRGFRQDIAAERKRRIDAFHASLRARIRRGGPKAVAEADAALRRHQRSAPTACREVRQRVILPCEHQLAAVPRPVRPVSTGSRAPRRPRGSASSTTSSADPPGDDGGDPDSDHDPAGEAIERLLDAAPPFSVGQRQLLARVLGGAR